VNCEQAEAIVLDLNRRDGGNTAERAAALAHVSHCSRCAALQESWDAAKEELRALAEETLDARAPARVEMRLLQEFRLRHRQAAARRAGFVAAWALAGAAVLLAGVSWWNKQHTKQDARQDFSAAKAPAAGTPDSQDAAAKLPAAVSGGDDNSSDFTPLPGVVSGDVEEAAILRVRMQRGSLGALGLPVNEQRAGDWIQVDLLVGADGSPQAVRLAEEEN